MVLKLEHVLESPTGHVTTQTAGFHPQSFRISGSGAAPETSVSGKLSGAAAAAGLGTTLGEPLV